MGHMENMWYNANQEQLLKHSTYGIVGTASVSKELALHKDLSLGTQH